MNISNQLLFFFSALGAFNGLFLSIYFAFFIKRKNRSTYFLAALLFVISFRVTKSVFLTFYPGTSSTFIHLGLLACLLIGPFLYLYTKVTIKPNRVGKYSWLVHVIPVTIFMIIAGSLFPYREYAYLWWRMPPRPFGVIRSLQWTLYVFASLYLIRGIIKKVFFDNKNATTQDFWLVTINLGNVIIWLAYNTTQYTSYIVGALSFSFTFYVTIFIWFYKRRQNSLAFLFPVEKYGSKKIGKSETEKLSRQLEKLFVEKELYKDATLKLPDVAKLLEVNTSYLSQYFNDNLGKSFTSYINEYRIESASKMIQTNNVLTLEAIGNECGFKSNSSFYSAFKKIKGMTPAQYKKKLL